jgi:hypothetical protein
MSLRWLRSSYRFPFLLLLGLVLAFVTSGCMWGVVRDADTGKPLAGVRVTITDTQGQTLTTTTDANGLFGFGAPVSASPARGPVNFQVDTPGYPTINETRDVLYDDNPNASFANMQSFWDVQTFNLSRGPGGYHSDEGGFGVTFPADWETQEEGTAVGASAPNSSANYPATCVVAALPMPAGMTLRALVNALVSALEDMESVSRVQRFETTDVELNGMAAVRAVYSYNVKITEGSQTMSLNLKEVMWAVGKNEKVYLIECSTFVEKFSSMMPLFENVAKSFRPD